MNPLAVTSWVLATGGTAVWIATAGAVGDQYADPAVLVTHSIAQGVGLAALPAALVLSGLRWLAGWWRLLPGSVSRDVARGDERADAEGSRGE